MTFSLDKCAISGVGYDTFVRMASCRSPHSSFFGTSPVRHTHIVYLCTMPLSESLTGKSDGLPADLLRPLFPRTRGRWWGRRRACQARKRPARPTRGKTGRRTGTRAARGTWPDVGAVRRAGGVAPAAAASVSPSTGRAGLGTHDKAPLKGLFVIQDVVSTCLPFS